MSQDTEQKEESLFEAPPMAEQERMCEAILFATAEPVTVKELESRMPHGCDPAEALASANAPVYLERLETARAEAQERMVSGIPAFFFGDVHVVGCQPFDSLALTAEKNGFARRAGSR